MTNNAPNVSDLSINESSDTTKAEIRSIKIDLLKSPPLVGHTVALSSSESDNLGKFGLSDLHLADLVIEINRYLLSTGASVAYGGDLRAGGLTEILIELVDQFKFTDVKEKDRLKSYLAFPLSLSLTKEMQAQYTHRVKFIKTIPPDDILAVDPNVFIPPVGSDNLFIWARSLTYMREKMEEECNARIFIGGRAQRYKGRAPGVLEEMLIALKAEKPIYLIGGFGGVVANVCSHLNNGGELKDVLDTIKASSEYQEMMQEYNRRQISQLMSWPDELFNELQGGWAIISQRNGLSIEENQKLAGTKHVYEIIYYLLKGLVNCLN
ncbi:hypothetical protein [Flavisolibacter ginsenosidimutans]|uniref:Uncharacterized protein n=1 Tax=Flavisolibacter ginsenosidimutans TaxID=661481 RepID=A0A5B8UKD9_9BACT|nr:hypothetical protein [Flavisolibacter ginsenosidimutans]QEC56639.1 hypothetical protein FSB75_12285 [Flavisolibacter ginsenosidimutans]